MAQTVTLSFRTDKDVKEQCEALYDELGMDLETALNVFMRQSLLCGGLPFAVRLPELNEETLAAL